MHDLRARMDENTLSDSSHTRSFEDEIQNSLIGILASDDSRRASFQLTYEEEQQIVAVSAYFFFLIVLVWSLYIFMYCFYLVFIFQF